MFSVRDGPYACVQGHQKYPGALAQDVNICMCKGLPGLHTLCELERDRVPHMDAVGRGPAAGVEEEGFTTLISVENCFKIPVGEDDTTAKEAVRFLARHLLEPVQELLVDFLGAEFVNQFAVVDRLDNAVVANLARHLCNSVNRTGRGI